MLLPYNINPQNAIYFQASGILQILIKHKKISVIDLYSKIQDKKVSFANMTLCLDFLYLLNLINLDKEGYIICI